MIRVTESEHNNYKVIVNSFYEIAPHYAELYVRKLGKQAWTDGPVSLCNTNIMIKLKEATTFKK